MDIIAKTKFAPGDLVQLVQDLATPIKKYPPRDIGVYSVIAVRVDTTKQSQERLVGVRIYTDKGCAIVWYSEDEFVLYVAPEKGDNNE